eukprot:7572835-Pyramimonas_sp.AAC.1
MASAMIGRPCASRSVSDRSLRSTDRVPTDRSLRSACPPPIALAEALLLLRGRGPSLLWM